MSNLTDTYSKEYLEDLYIKQNLKKQDIADKLNITIHALTVLLKDYNIHKISEEVLQKRIDTNMKKYGVANPSKSPEVIDKIKQTNLERYGATCYTATQDGIEKSKQTKLERYGDSHYNNMSKNQQTKLERYGNEKYNNRDKMKETCQERYGIDNPFQMQKVVDMSIERMRQNYTEEFKEIFDDRSKAIEFLSNGKYCYHDLAKRFNAPYNVIQTWVTKLNIQEYIDYTFRGESSYEGEIKDFLKSLNITNITEHYTLPNNQEIDIFLPDFNIGIEFNGTYWHSSLFKDNTYHLNKSKLAEQQGIRLIHIYQYEWDEEDMREKIKSLIKIATNSAIDRIYARECEIKKITNDEAMLFNDKNHLQGHRNAQVTYGLFYNNELVQLMSFSKTKYNKNLKEENSWEIIRGCPGSNNIVVGGVSKLFTHFLRDYNPNKVFSYCDFNKFDGKGYEAIGMKFIGYTKPDMSWVLNYSDVVKRNPKKHKELKDQAICQLFGAGSKKYLYTRDGF